MSKRRARDYSNLHQASSSEEAEVGFFEKLEAIKDVKAKIEFATDYASRIYGIDKSQFMIPQQGEQTFTFIANASVIRLARWPGVSKIMENEVAVLSTLNGRTSSQTPAVLDFQPDMHIMLISRLPGGPLSKERFEALPKATQESILKRTGKFLGEMHNLFPLSDKIEEPWWKEAVLQKIETQIKKEKDPDKGKRLQEAAEYTKQYGASSEETCVMLHGDLHGGNIMYDEKSDALGFIDFTSAKVGAAHRDIFKLRRALPDDLYAIVVSSYEKTTGRAIDQSKVNAALDSFCIFTGNPLDNTKPLRAQHGVRKSRPNRSFNIK